MGDHEERRLALWATEVLSDLPRMNPRTLNPRQALKLRGWVGRSVQHSGRLDDDLPTAERNAAADLSRSLKPFVVQAAEAIGFFDWEPLFAVDYQARAAAWEEFQAYVEEWDRKTFREKVNTRGAFNSISLEVCSSLRAVLDATDVTRFDGIAARNLEEAFYRVKRNFSFVRYYRERYHEETGTFYSCGKCMYAEELQDAIVRLYYDFEPVIHAIAARFKWQPDGVAKLFRKAGSPQYVLAWYAFILAAEVQTADPSPAPIAAPQQGPAAFTGTDSRQPVEWSNIRSPQQWRDLRTEKDLPDGKTWWKDEKKRDPQAFTGTTRRVKITRAKAEEWELELPEFKPHS